jgi:hypothetical protein
MALAVRTNAWNGASFPKCDLKEILSQADPQNILTSTICAEVSVQYGVTERYLLYEELSSSSSSSSSSMSFHPLYRHRAFYK